MSAVLAAGCLAELLIAGVLLVRVAGGPTVSDRIVALNTMSTQVTLAVLLYSAYADRASYADAALWLASFSYLGTLVWSRYLERGLL